MYKAVRNLGGSMNSIIKNIEIFLKVFITYVIPLVSFGISIFALYRSNKAWKTKDRIRDLELFIKEHNVKRIKQRENIVQKSEIKAKAIKTREGIHKIKIWNSGNQRAFNISIDIPAEYKIDLLADKIPYEHLEPGENFEENIAVHMGSYRKFRIITTWEDEDGKRYTTKQLSSI